jgi:hypothetical protein
MGNIAQLDALLFPDNHEYTVLATNWVQMDSFRSGYGTTRICKIKSRFFIFYIYFISF